MTVRQLKRIRLILLPMLLLLLLATRPLLIYAATDSTTDLSQVNWDEEDTTEKADQSGKGSLPQDKKDQSGIDSNNLATESWEDDNTQEDTDTSGGLTAIKKEDLEKLESRERLIHITGFFMFMGYLIGGVLTAFFTRNSRFAVDYPPELLIILHTVWPLEILLYPIFGRPRG